MINLVEDELCEETIILCSIIMSELKKCPLGFIDVGGICVPKKKEL